MNTLERLDKWWGGEKGRFVRIEQDTTYGATAWTCELGHLKGKRKVVATEVFFFTDEDGNIPYPVVDDEGWNVYPVAVNDKDVWCGPERVIQLALETVKKEGI